VTTRAEATPRPGELISLTVGEPVHGGWCVSRHNGTGWVVFVRHALPGEQVTARVTQVTSRFARAEAIEVTTPSPDRVPVPCRYAGPGGCGGCDWQHASLPAQRELKATVIRQQLKRLAGLDAAVTVAALPGGDDGLGWRTSVSFAVAPDGTAGLRRHRSREIIAIDECLIAHPLVTAAGVTGRRWPGAQQVQVGAVPATGERGLLLTGDGRPRSEDLAELGVDTVLARGAVPGSRAVPARGAASARERTRRTASVTVRGTGHLTQQAAGHAWRVALGGFWQVHPAAADTLAAAVLDMLRPQPGDSALDLYCGAGLFAGVIARAVGSTGSVLAVDEDRAAVRDARRNLRDWPWARVVAGDVARVLRGVSPGDDPRIPRGVSPGDDPRIPRGVSPGGPPSRAANATLAVLDPPRSGLARGVTRFLCEAAPALRRIAYVSCDPATLARDLRLLLDGGWRLDGIRAFDAFPMTHHVECVAALSYSARPQ
jgi:tRNA/tmRNA/rRNA uracil-C5-methylase (TrmA/RlmC/RlmD family)